MTSPINPVTLKVLKDRTEVSVTALTGAVGVQVEVRFDDGSNEHSERATTMFNRCYDKKVAMVSVRRGGTLVAHYDKRDEE